MRPGRSRSRLPICPGRAEFTVEQVQCVVIGAGVVGLAAARSLVRRGCEVMVLEAAPTFGTGTSSRNSEVIHAGIYYTAGSLKARLCVQGRSMLYAYCAERGVGHRRCGKLLVATAADQVPGLRAIVDRARCNGVDDLVVLDATQARALESELRCEAAIYSPSTGIVDSHALMLALYGEIGNAGGMVVFNSPVEQARCAHSAIELVAVDGTQLRATMVVNAAGLHAPALAARFAGLEASQVPRAYFAKGNYFTLGARTPFRHLIYPVPQAGGLGVHLTLDLAGQARFGPDVQWVDTPDDLTVQAARADAFYAEVRKYWPGLPGGALMPGYAGIRPKIDGPGSDAADFWIAGPAQHGVRGLVNLFGIESPGLTSALAIGEHVARLLLPGV